MAEIFAVVAPQRGQPQEEGPNSSLSLSLTKFLQIKNKKTYQMNI